MHVTNNQFSAKVNNGWKKNKMADLLSFLVERLLYFFDDVGSEWFSIWIISRQ